MNTSLKKGVVKPLQLALAVLENGRSKRNKSSKPDQPHSYFLSSLSYTARSYFKMTKWFSFTLPQYYDYSLTCKKQTVPEGYVVPQRPLSSRGSRPHPYRTPQEQTEGVRGHRQAFASLVRTGRDWSFRFSNKGNQRRPDSGFFAKAQSTDLTEWSRCKPGLLQHCLKWLTWGRSVYIAWKKRTITTILKVIRIHVQCQW